MAAADINGTVTYAGLEKLFADQDLGGLGLDALQDCAARCGERATDGMFSPENLDATQVRISNDHRSLRAVLAWLLAVIESHTIALL
jgi:hypothetical protein